MIKQWQERTAEITGILTTRHIQEAMQAEIDDLRAENSRLKKDLEISTLGASQTLLDLCKENERLRTAAQAVIDRWDTPHWKDVPATAEYIGRLRAALGEKS